ncbi:hypothetical protein MKZ38_008376 [Zalerion maritima]|uniref:Zinc metalloprotease n=1 Tax=Zalerion maritima TaxID=339359 RepID=A0AAD5RU85_9PEZI|nr:hypothetical protein MKZ38_008376 [Zalerion maritima]
MLFQLSGKDATSLTTHPLPPPHINVRDASSYFLLLIPPNNFSVHLPSMREEMQPSRFRKVQSFKTEYAPAKITRFVSDRSGMQVVVVDRKGPKVNGYFALATEIFDDSGAPHTLEHLVFMGSKSYRYKGLLDKLASRAYSTTNAWTATDHTAYTLDTAGWDGFAQILPVYLEHVLVPTLTDEGCYTEVYHVDPEAKDAGVVFSEMQAVQYTSDELMNVHARRLMYPENIGFRYETGGMMEALRVLTPERIREFHKDMYQPRNLCLVIVGEINHPQLLQILDEFEQSIQDHIPSLESPFKRPWIESKQPPPLNKTVVETIEFPDDDESSGGLVVAYLGPDVTNLIDMTALNIVSTYLCGSSVSVLENIMVEKEELASSIQTYAEARPDTLIWFQPTGVATDKLEFVYKRLLEVLKQVAEEPLNMDYLQECIKRERRQIIFHAETSEFFFSTNIINAYLFGKRDGSTLAELETVAEYGVLEMWTESQWKDFMRKWLIDAHHIAVLGKPSVEMSKMLKREEKERVAKRKTDLGEKGLEGLKVKLEAAKAANDQPIPDEVLDRWSVPDTESIHFIESDTARSGRARSLGLESNGAQKIIDSKSDSNSLFIQFEHVPTNFVHIKLHVGASKVPMHLKPLIPIFMDNFFNTPITRDGKTVGFEDVVRDLERDTISYKIRTAYRTFSDGESIGIEMAVERSKYSVAVEWLKILVSDAIFDPVRIRAAITKALADVPEMKREGPLMSSEIDVAMHMVPESLTAAKRWLVKAVHYKRLRNTLQKETETVLGWFEELKAAFFDMNNVRVLVTADLERLERPVETWDPLTSVLKLNGDSKTMVPIVAPASVRSEAGMNPGKEGVIIVPMTTLESSFSVSTASGPTSWKDPRIPALEVALHYLETIEGPLWVATRGSGLAYGVNFYHDLDTGMLQFKVYRAPDAFKALAASAASVRSICGTGKDGDEGTPLEKHLFEGAISQIVVSIADGADTMPRAATTNIIRGVIRELPKGWDQANLAAVRAVTESDVKEAMREIIMPVFEPGTSNVAVTCALQTKDDIEKAFQEAGFKTNVKQLSDFYADYGLEARDDDKEGGDDEEEEDDEVSDTGGTDSGSEED